MKKWEFYFKTVEKGNLGHFFNIEIKFREIFHFTFSGQCGTIALINVKKNTKNCSGLESND